MGLLRRIADMVFGKWIGKTNERRYNGRDVKPASEDPYGDPADQVGAGQARNVQGQGRFGNVKPASEDPYGDPANQ